MSVMYLLIMLSLILATGFVLAFVWAIRSGQYDDKYTPSVRILFDDEPAATVSASASAVSAGKVNGTKAPGTAAKGMPIAVRPSDAPSARTGLAATNAAHGTPSARTGLAATNAAHGTPSARTGLAATNAAHGTPSAQTDSKKSAPMAASNHEFLEKNK
jgi:cbb3-type cytochrome oxidase maturation protein